MLDKWYAPRWYFKRGNPIRAATRALASASLYASDRSATPNASPTLSIDTVWYTPAGQELHINALVDTGCNTSLVQKDLLQRVADKHGMSFAPKALQNPTALTAASGSPVKLSNMANLEFSTAGIEVDHCFYVVDSISVSEQIILGMDFLVKYQASIEIPKGLITLSLPPGLPCWTANVLRLQSGETQRVGLVTDCEVQSTPVCFMLRTIFLMVVPSGLEYKIGQMALSLHTSPTNLQKRLY